MHSDNPTVASSTLLDAEAQTSGWRQPALHRLVSAVCAPALSLSDDDGQIRSGGAQGLYVQDMRVLSELLVTVDGLEPTPIGVNVEGGGHNQFDATIFKDGFASPDPVFFLTRRRRLCTDGMLEEMIFSSLARRRVTLRLGLHLSSDLAEIISVKLGHHLPPEAASAVPGGLRWGTPSTGRAEALGAPHPDRIDVPAGDLEWDLVMEPGETRCVSLTVLYVEESQPVVIPLAQDSPIDGARERLSVEAKDPRLERLLDQGLADLAGLTMATSLSPTDPFVAAGVPWYLTLFGRDSLWTARMLLPLGTEIARGTLRTLARRQGEKLDSVTNEEPGKILHELRQERTPRRDPSSDAVEDFHLGLPPVYYGTVDATPLWVCLLHDAWRWGMARADVEDLLDPMERCLKWIADYGCGDRPFVSYVDRSGHGLANQGWKDSSDGVQHRDGRLATAPIALCEAQGYAYEAVMHGADLLDAFDRPGGGHWRGFAASLSTRFREAFWVHDELGPYPAIALDATGEPIDSLTSNIGHLLGTGLLSADEEQLVARRLGQSDLNSGFGLRTLAASSAGFNPLSYHCGSVWAHDTAIAISGLRTVPGLVAEEAAASLIEGLLSAAAHFGFRLPELFAGDTRSTQSGPRNYPASCHPQAWAAASAVSILAAIAGVRPDVPRGVIDFRPLANFDQLSLHGVRLGDTNLEITLREGETASLTGVPSNLRISS